MRVLIVCLSVNFFGTERHAVELADALAEQHEVAILVRRRPREPDRRAGHAALMRAISPRVRLFTAGRRLPQFGLARAIVQFRPDIVHAHLERSVRCALRLPLRPPLIATAHFNHVPQYDACDGLICLTPAQRDALPPRPRGVVFQIGNWVLPHTATDRGAARRALGLAEQEFVVGSVGRLDPVKRFPDLVAAFLAADLPEARLVIVGEGGDATALRALADASDGRVRLAGFRPDIRDLYPAFDLFVLNSAEEPFGLVLLEALDAGLPIVTTATDGACAIADRSPLHLIPVGDRAALIDALRLARASRLAASPVGASPFRIEAVLPSIVEAYREVIARRRRSASYANTMPSTTQT